MDSGRTERETNQPMQIDIIVDTVCPWCYIGKARFEKALQSRPIGNVRIGWRPFQLNPHLPPAGIDRDSYLVEKFGSVDRAVQWVTAHAGDAEACDAGQPPSPAAVQGVVHTVALSPGTCTSCSDGKQGGLP